MSLTTNSRSSGMFGLSISRSSRRAIAAGVMAGAIEEQGGCLDAPWARAGGGGPAPRGGTPRAQEGLWRSGGVQQKARRPRKSYSLKRMPINANLKQLAEEEERDEAMATVGRKKFGVLGNAALQDATRTEHQPCGAQA